MGFQWNSIKCPRLLFHTNFCGSVYLLWLPSTPAEFPPIKLLNAVDEIKSQEHREKKT